MSYNTPEDRRSAKNRSAGSAQTRTLVVAAWEDVYTVDLKPRRAKTRDRKREEMLRIKMLTYEQATD
jgi:hypothetical protein